MERSLPGSSSLLAVVLLILGYVALAHFVVFNSVLTLVYVSILYVVRQLDR